MNVFVIEPSSYGVSGPGGAPSTSPSPAKVTCPSRTRAAERDVEAPVAGEAPRGRRAASAGVPARRGPERRSAQPSEQPDRRPHDERGEREGPQPDAAAHRASPAETTTSRGTTRGAGIVQRPAADRLQPPGGDEGPEVVVELAGRAQRVVEAELGGRRRPVEHALQEPQPDRVGEGVEDAGGAAPVRLPQPLGVGAPLPHRLALAHADGAPERHRAARVPLVQGVDQPQVEPVVRQVGRRGGAVQAGHRLLQRGHAVLELRHASMIRTYVRTSKGCRSLDSPGCPP